jgi:hypothetical protein
MLSKIVKSIIDHSNALILKLRKIQSAIQRPDLVDQFTVYFSWGRWQPPHPGSSTLTLFVMIMI